MPSTRSQPKRGAAASATPQTNTTKGKTKQSTSSRGVGRPKKSTTTTAPAAKTKGKSQSARKVHTPSKHGAQNEDEILTAFRVFAISRAGAANSDDDEAYQDNDEDDEDEGVIPNQDVRRCLAALHLPPPPPDFFEDEDEDEEGAGYMSWAHFLELAQTLRDSAQDEDNDEEMKDEINEEQRTEINNAFSLFVYGSSGTNKTRPTQQGGTTITLADLKRVARELREEVDEKTLRLMIEEANGEAGKDSVERGVGRAEFENVMRRAGVFKS